MCLVCDNIRLKKGLLLLLIICSGWTISENCWIPGTMRSNRRHATWIKSKMKTVAGSMI